MAKKVLAFDFGASSGRAMLGSLEGGEIVLKEIHRFPNNPKRVNGTFTWDFDDLWANVKIGIKKGAELGGFDSIGIDTWGVDFGCIDKDGNLIANPVHYRDERTEGIPEQVFKTMSKDEIYDICGIQCIRFNTLYQLWYLKNYEKELYDKTDKVLMIPDLFAYLLTGAKRFELTDASTTNTLNAKTQKVDVALMEKLGLRADIFAEPIYNGQEYGLLKEELAQELGCERVPVIAVCTHDTASAVASIPSNAKDNVYISSGTWSLMGIENDGAILTEEAKQLNFANEIGYNGKVRFLKNIMGLWILQQMKKAYNEQGRDIGFGDMEKWAVAEEDAQSYINVDDPMFEAPGDMSPRIEEYCAKTNQPIPTTDQAKVRCVYESLALKYADTLKKLEEISGINYERLYVIGGGTQAKLLIKLSANACGIGVSAGPVEATATGNVAVQLIAQGEIADLVQARDIIAKSKDIWIAEPQDIEKWQQKLVKYREVIAR